MTLSFDDTPWIRSYAVWSQLAVEPAPLDGATSPAARGREPTRDHHGERDGDNRAVAHSQDALLT